MWFLAPSLPEKNCIYLNLLTSMKTCTSDLELENSGVQVYHVLQSPGAPGCWSNMCYKSTLYHVTDLSGIKYFSHRPLLYKFTTCICTHVPTPKHVIIAVFVCR